MKFDDGPIRSLRNEDVPLFNNSNVLSTSNGKVYLDFAYRPINEIIPIIGWLGATTQKNRYQKNLQTNWQQPTKLQAG